MQSQMARRSQIILPDATVAQDSFTFYNKGKEMWKESYQVQDDFEYSLRHQLEQSDWAQGFQISSDVASGNGSLTKILIQEFIRDEAPKAPVMLYAVESRNMFSEEKEPLKFALAKLNRGLWLGDLLPTVDLAIPFDSEFIQSDAFTSQQLIKDHLQGYKSDLSYHRSALQSLIMHALTSRLVRPDSAEDFMDIQGKKYTDL